MSFSISWTDFSEKADVKDISQHFILKKDETIDFSSAQSGIRHTFIEGDNYPALKLLLSEYREKIDLIYTDPPYNTGKNFTYRDNMQTDEWLSFMQRRLCAARKLLKDSGCIFIAIGQSQVHLLKILCDQIFGENNFVNDFMWLHGKGKKDKWSRTLQQSNLCYAKNKKKLKEFSDFEQTGWATSNADGDRRGAWFSGSISFDEKRSNPKSENYYEIVSPGGIRWKRQWLIPEAEMKQLIKEDKIYWGKAPEFSNVPRKKVFNGEKVEIIPRNIIDGAESTRKAQKHLDELLCEKKSFDNPKPVNLIQHFIQIVNMPDDITIMDFFAGSGSTLEATIEQNRLDGGTRKCMLIQKPEKIENPGRFQSIAELCLARIKKVLSTTRDSLDCLHIEEQPGAAISSNIQQIPPPAWTL